MITQEQFAEQVMREMPTPHPESLITHTVVFKPSALLTTLATYENREMQRIMRFTGQSVILSPEEIHKYFSTILWLRTVQVRNQFSGRKEYSFALKNLNIPVRLYQIVSSLGEVCDLDFGLKFIPSMEIDTESLLTPEELREYSDRIGWLIPEGYLVVETGLPSDTTGELGFMACLVTKDEKVFSYRKDHPVYGFIAAFFDSELVEKAFTNDYRVFYGVRSDYENIFQRIYK